MQNTPPWRLEHWDVNNMAPILQFEVQFPVWDLFALMVSIDNKLEWDYMIAWRRTVAPLINMV